MGRGLLADRTAVVTGGASGMGRASVLRFCAEGASVVVGDLNEESGAATLDAAAREGFADRIRFVAGDVSDENVVAELIARAETDFGPLGVMFNNAGIGGAFGDICDIEVADWDATFAVNCRGVFVGIKHAARAMRAHGGGGAIVSTASIGALSGDNAPIAYSAAKAGVVNLTMSAAVALAADRIRVNCICPGSIMTPLLVRDVDYDRASAMLVKAQPWPAPGQPDDIANAALFLASDLSEFVNGVALTVDGGAMAEGPHINQRLAELVRTPRNSSGISRGSTGEAATIRRVPPPAAAS